MNVIMKDVYQLKILPIILNPPVQEKPKESGFNLNESKTSNRGSFKIKGKGEVKEKGSKKNGCCK